MATAPILEAKFWPPRLQDYIPGQQLIAGGVTVAPLYIGALDLAVNSNEIVGSCGNTLAQQVWDTELTVSFTDALIQTLGYYCVQIPAVRKRANGRTALSVSVTASTSAGSLVVQAGTVTELGAAITSPVTTIMQTVTCYVDAVTGVDVTSSDGSGDTLQLVTVYIGVTAPPATVVIESIKIEPANASDSGAYATTDLAFAGHPSFAQDVAAWDPDSPMNVRSVQELIANNNNTFIHSFHHIVNVTLPFPTAYSASTLGAVLTSAVTPLNEWHPMTQYVYWPRPEVKHLKVALAAHVAAWTVGHNALVRMSWADGAYVEGTVAAATTVWTAGSWVVWNELLPVPNKEGPLFLTLSGKITDYSLAVQGISVIEVVDRSSLATHMGTW